MAERAKKSNKIIFIIAGAIVVLAIVVTAILLNRGNKAISDDFFVSDDKKYVLTIDDISYGATKAHSVVYYQEDTVTGMEDYIEYADEEAAKLAFEDYKDYRSAIEDNSEYELNGKYIIIKYPEEKYKDTSASDIKKWFDFYQQPNEEPVEESVEETIEETVEE